MKNLRLYLTEYRIPVARFARRVGVKPPSVHRWLKGRAEPGFKNLKRCAHLTGLTIDELIGYKPDRRALALREARSRRPAIAGSDVVSIVDSAPNS